MKKRITIDGGAGEGGGQILRTSLSLAALLGKPLAIHNIRAGRRNPGLRPQHLASVQAMARICGAELSGDRENSTSLLFTPHGIEGGCYRFSIGTAGSVTLLLAAILPPLLFARTPSVIRVEGGTHVPFSPVFHYMNEIFLPCLGRMGVEAEARLEAWGWYPAGGGACMLRVVPCHGLLPLQIPQRGKLRKLDLMLGLAGLPLHIVEREEKKVRACLDGRGYAWTRRFEPAPSPGEGNVLFLKGEYEHGMAGFSELGRKGKPAEQVAEGLCRQWMTFENGPGAVDKHLADQLLLYMALADGQSMLTTEEITGHLLANIQVIEQFLPVRFKLDQNDCSVRVSGAACTGGGGERSR